MKILSRPLRGVLFLLSVVTCVGAQAQEGVTVIDRAKLRETPSISGQMKQEYPNHTEIRILDQKGRWFVVRIADTVGWMFEDDFELASAQVERAIAAPRTQSAPSRPDRVESTPIQSSTTTQSTTGGYIRGPRGGCYYINKSGKKVYVDHSLCH